MRRRLFFIMLPLVSAPWRSAAAQQASPYVPPYQPYGAVEEAYSPAWSPDGKQLLFARVGDERGLYVTNAAGGLPRPVLVDGSFYTQPDWSRDGKRIVFGSDRSGRMEVWSARPDGSDLRKISDQAGSSYQPRWSPDGRQIAFVNDGTIRIVPADGGPSQAIARGWWPAWSPDGKRLAFSAGSPPASQPIALKDVDGPGGIRLASSPDNSPLQAVDWSPDGTKLVCLKLVDGSFQMVVLDVAGDRVDHRVATSQSAFNPRWSPDGRRLAFTTSGTGEPSSIEIIDADGRNPTTITTPRRFTAGELVRYRSADGVEIPAFLYRPKAAGDRRPVLIWLHGGLGGFTANTFDRDIQYFVDQGFGVLAPNYRSSGGFGPEIARVDAHALVSDVVAGEAYVRTLGWVDTARIGLIGFSFGGLATLMTLVQRPDGFAAAADFFGPADLATWFRDAPGSRPLLQAVLGGTPEQQPQAYHAASPVNFVDRLHTPLLIVHGDADQGVPVSQSHELDEALQHAGKDHELVVIARGDHGFTSGGKAQAMEAAMRFFLARLGEPARAGRP